MQKLVLFSQQRTHSHPSTNNILARASSHPFSSILHSTAELLLSLPLFFSLAFAYLQVHDASTFSAHHRSPYSRLNAKSLIALHQGTMGLYPSPTARWFRSGQKLSASRATSLVAITMVFPALSPFRWTFLHVRKHTARSTCSLAGTSRRHRGRHCPLVRKPPVSVVTLDPFVRTKR